MPQVAQYRISMFLTIISVCRALPSGVKIINFQIGIAPSACISYETPTAMVWFQ